MSEAAALRALKAFMKQMSAWEKESNKLVERVEKGKLDIDDVIREQIEKLQQLQDEFCTASKWRRSSFNVEGPAEYDVRTNKIKSCTLESPTKALVEMRQTVGAETLVRLELLLVDGEWKVSRRWALFKGKKPLACEL